jgi:4-hydroxyphenylacetate 3-monooxygenase
MPARTGAQYLEGLRDGREIWLDGERVKDVTTDARLARAARSIAALYDLQHRAELRDKLTYASPTSGDRVGLSFLQPRTPEDLVRRRGMFTLWADRSGGMLGRTPDYLNALLMGCAAARDFFARNDPAFGGNMARYYEMCREGDLCLTHSVNPPQMNRTVGPGEQADPAVPLHIVKETDAGMVVSGARQLATLGPFSDEVMIFPSPSKAFRPGFSPYALAFCLPAATPGMKLVCRRGFETGGSTFDYPLTARFDEQDSLVLFDNVLVPWERVFLKGDMDLCNTLWRETHAFMHGIHQFTAKNLAKAEFVLGVASLVAETIGIEEFLHVQDMLGETVDAVETIRAYLRAAEADAVPAEGGTVAPNPDIMWTARDYFPRVYPRLVEILQTLGSSGLISTVPEATADGELAADVEKYLQSGTLGGRERVRLFRLAWDMACSSFAGRQVLYERYFAGDFFRNRAARYTMYRKDAVQARVREFLARGPDA